MKHTIILTLIALLFTSGINPAYASEKEAYATASLSNTDIIIDQRVIQLTHYLQNVNSPMANDAEQIVREADRFGLDWKLVASIAGVESYFGQHIPQNSYNGWGWAIFTGHSDGRHFENWQDGITQVSQGLKEKYVDKGRTTVEQIGPIYAADPSWAWKVNHFMAEIESYLPRSTSELSIAL